MDAVTDRQAWLATAETAAVQAGALLREMLAQPRELISKGYRDLVTDADFAAQKLITDLIRQRFPKHAFLVEEKDPSLPRAGSVQWVIDPVDGTSNYSRQQPNFSVSIGVAVSGESVVGVIYDPMRDEMFSAVAGQGSRLNGHAIQVSSEEALASAIIAVDWSRTYELRQAMLTALTGFAHEVKTIRAIGSAALALAWIAAGRLDGYLNFGLFPWDVAAGSLLIREAGGVMTDDTGRPLVLEGALRSAASNGRIHARFLELIRPPGH